MSTKQAGEKRTGEKRAEEKAQEVGLLEAVVRGNVLCDLGEPPGPHLVQVKCVWGDSYRVNVFVGPNVSSFKVAHSYFLKADGDGKILTCTPAITKMY
jgi:hypothetical protein